MRYIIILTFSLLLFSCNESPEKNNKVSVAPLTDQERIVKASKEIKSKPSAISFEKRSDLYYDMGEISLAFDDIKNSLKLDSTIGRTYYKTARIFRKMARINNSINYAVKATQYGFNEGSVYLLLGENYLIFRKYQAAIDNLNQAMRVDRFNEKIYFYKGMVYKESGEFKEAQSSFQTAVELSPQYAEAYNQLITLALEKEDYVLAQTYIESGIRFNPEDAFLWFNQGVSLQEQGLLDSCIIPYLKSFRYDSTLTLSAFNLGFVYHEQKKYDESLIKINRVLKLEPNNVSALYMNALNYNELNEKELAIQKLKKALTINPQYKVAQTLYDKLK